MAKLNDDERKLLEELSARASAPDEDDDYEIEVYDTAANKGARIPYRTGKSWLFETFGIGNAPESARSGEGGDATGSDAPPTGGTAEKGGKQGGQGSYFGRK